MQAEPQINKLFRWAIRHGSPGLRLEPECPPRLLGRSGIGEAEICLLKAEHIEELLHPIIDPEVRHALNEKSKAEFTYRVGDNGLFLVRLENQDGKTSMEAMFLGAA